MLLFLLDTVKEEQLPIFESIISATLEKVEETLLLKTKYMILKVSHFNFKDPIVGN
jgi:hypothetical protein